MIIGMHHEGKETMLGLTCGLIVVDVDSLELEVRISMVSTSGVDSMLIRDNLPELKK